MTNSTDTPARLADAPRLQARNSAAFWAATGRSRGHEVIRRRGFLAVAGDERAGLRVLIQEPDLTADELAEMAGLAREAAEPVDMEDPFSATELGHLGMGSWQMPIMLRPPGGVEPAAVPVQRVRSESDLHGAERAVIESFGLHRFEPYRPGEMFPAALLDEPGVELFVARVDGEVACACVTVAANGFGSHYWVGTTEAARSRGIGRAVMLGSLAPLAQIPVTLTASKLGVPLYEKLGFASAAPSTWWSSSRA
ncbi:GNAT family N-acetyltransferase [Glycomyces tritici]|uniref:GNAT family N-acetyltransferase n=1 Tax=Glycomyces tritici TaxID=2665176 RepID=A0ABT7YV32_9ACTN|nr:GNAT family N-acetyltransferase [Glycomyces tritici]MDN3242489.1 GNAT family N-acetyltransferase [Glycomyces tritici]